MKNTEIGKKRLNSIDVIATAFGAMIGWGWVVSSGGWISSSGVLGTIAGFVIGGIMIYFVGLAYSELTTSMPNNGGEMMFSRKAFGKTVSFICTWSIILSYIGVVCFEACSLPTIVSYIFPGVLKGYLYTVQGFNVYASWLIIAIISSILLTVINIIGIKAAANFQKALTFVIMGVGLLLVIFSLFNGSPDNISEQLFVGGTKSDIVKNILAISVVAPFYLFGFDVIPQVAEEINVPLKKLGKLLVSSIVMAVAFYSLVVFAIGYGLSSDQINNSVAQNGLATVTAMSNLFKSTSLTKILIFGGLCGIITSWNSFLIGGSRALCELANQGMAPKIFAKSSKNKNTPIGSLTIICLISIVSVFFGKPMLVWISNSASFACCLAYCVVSCSFLKIRMTDPELERPFKIKNYKFVGFCSIIMSAILCALYLIPGSGCTMVRQEVIICFGWAIIGLIFYMNSARAK